ncbi:UNVERIFIED_CONTAM: hypothetical protein HDU68_010096 [Siphonaria sp. JEL0065]|nr:hypothetical protein HDU68_010096 [Siphonaria sp. JEL0065]
MFKGFKYKTCDLTVHVLRGYLTFRFWNLTNRPSSPPINIRLDGFELFIYNNSSAYEYLKSILEKEKQQKQQQDQQEPTNVSPVTVESHPSGIPRSSKDHFANNSLRGGNPTAAIDVEVKSPLPSPTLSYWEVLVSRLFPFQIVGLQGAIVIGNSDIASMMVVDFKEMSGVYACEVIAPAIPNVRPELCRYDMKLRLQMCRLSFRKNLDFRDPSLNQAARARISKMQHETIQKRRKFWPEKRRGATGLDTDGGFGAELGEEGVEWIGLVRYNDDFDNGMGGKSSIEEYAKIEDVILSEYVDVVYYTEDPGIEGVDRALPPPKWGVDLILSKSNDPQFVEDSVNMEARRIQLSLRTAGWLNFAFKGDNSFLRFDIPMLAPPSGYNSVISLRIENLSLTTSMNYTELLAAETFELECLLQSPLKWNGERVWKYNLCLNNSKLHYLQDHMTLIQDLSSDLSYSQSPPNPTLFVPIAYQIKVSFKNLDSLLCTNRNNVIHIANDPDENSFIGLKMNEAELDIEMPFLLSKPVLYGMKFSLTAESGTVTIMHPLSHSIGAFLTSRDVGCFQTLKAEGGYEYYDTYAAVPDGPDSITLNIELDTSVIKAYGFVITSFFDFLSNYLGECSHVISIEDYRLKLSDPLKFKAQRAKMQYDTQNANPLEVSLDISAVNSFVILPENLFDCNNSSILHLDTITLEMASNMTEQILKAVTSPIAWTRSKIPSDFSIETINNAFKLSTAEIKNCLNIAGLEVLNRRLFGPSPKCITYASDTIVHCRSIVGEILPDFLRGVNASLTTIAHHLRDADDSLLSKINPSIDVYKVRIDPIKVSLWGAESVTLIEFSRGIKVQFDTLISKKWTDRTLVDLPSIDIKVLTISDERALKWENQEWIEVFKFETSVSVCLFTYVDDIETRRSAQRAFVLSQDIHTLRCNHLFQNGEANSAGSTAFKVPSGFDFELDYDHEPGRHARAKTDLSDGYHKSDVRAARSAGASPLGSRAGSFLGSSFTLDSKYKTHLRTFRETHNSRNHMSEFIAFYNDFGPTKPKNRRAFPYQDVELLCSVEFTESVPHSKVIVRASECVNALVTPFALKAIQQFVQISLDDDYLLGSSLLDTLHVYYTNLIVRPILSNAQYTTLIVSVPEMHIQSVQDLQFPDIVPSLDDTFGDIKTRYGYSESSLCSVDVQAVNLLQIANAGFKTGAQALNAQRLVDAHYSLDLALFKLGVRFLGSLAAGKNQKIIGIPLSKQLSSTEIPDIASSNPVVLEAYCSDIKWLCDFENGTSASPSNIAINMQSQTFELVFINETAEIVAGAVAVWVVFTDDLYHIASKYMDQEQRRLQSFIEAVIHESVKQSVVGDPKYLVSPCSLWLLGNGLRKFQTDLGWRLLSHLRYCAIQLGSDHIRSLLKERKSTEGENTYWSEISPVLQKWFGVRDDRADASKNHILSMIFDTNPKGAEATAVDMIKMLSTCTTSVVFVIQHVKVSTFEPGSSDNIFQLSPVLLDVSSSLRNIADIVGKSSSGGLVFYKDSPQSHFVDVLALVSVSKASISFNPNIFRLLRHIIRVYNRVMQMSLLGTSSKTTSSLQSIVTNTMDYGFIASTVVEEISLSATANNLSMRTVMRNIALNLTYFSKSAVFNLPERLQYSGTASAKTVMVDVLEISAYGSNSLVALKTDGLVATISGPSSSLLAFELIEIRLPKSLLKLQAFLEQWSDSLPEYDLLFNKFLKELERSNSSFQELKNSQAQLSVKLMSNIQIVVKCLIIVSDLLSTLRCRYSVSNLMLLLQREVDAAKSDLGYVARVGSHKVEFETRSSSHHLIKTMVSASPSMYLLPDVNLEGSFSSTDALSSFTSALFVGTLEGTFDVHLIDRLLTLQLLLGSEVNDIIEMAMFYYLKRTDGSAVVGSTSAAKRFLYDIKIRVSGVEVSAESPQSNLLLSSGVSTLQIKNTDNLSSLDSLNWTFSLGNCSLALISGSRSLAKIAVDVQLRNHTIRQGGFEFLSKEMKDEKLETIFVQIVKLNGVLHPVGLGKVIDFMLFYSKELDERSRVKTVEMGIMKQNAQRLFSSVNAPTNPESNEVKNFFLDKLVLVQVDNVGISFPVTHDSRDRGDSLMPALLICLEDIQYESYCFVENFGGIKDISVQFVDNFDSQVESSFLASSHPVQNRFLLRQIQGNIQQYFKEGFGSVKINASIQGFDLNLNSTITEHLNSLISVYITEKAHFDHTVSSAPSNTAFNKAPATLQSQIQSFTELMFEADFIFGAGVCKINCQNSNRSEESNHLRKASNNSGQNEENYDEQVFTIPGIGFQVNGTTCFGDDSHLTTRIQRGIYITQHIYESENMLHPSVLSFFLNAAANIKLDSLPATKPNPSSPQTSDTAISSLESQQHTVTFFLKLSQTKVSLSCLPESKVNLNFVLEEADMLASFVPANEHQLLNAINLTCCVKGMSGSLRHTFSPEDCFRWSVSQLLINASVLFNHNTRTFLVNFDSASISAALNVRQLHDLLLFQRLWITPLIPSEAPRKPAPVSNQDSALASLLRLPGFSAAEEKAFQDAFHFTLRLPSVSLSTDFGQSVGKTTITALDFVSTIDICWTNDAFGAKQLISSLSSIRCVSDGRFSGDAHILQPQLYTLGSNNFSQANSKNITLGLFNLEKVYAQMQFQYERILIVDLQPLDYIMTQRWIVHEGSLTLFSDIKVIFDSFKVVVSRKTVPAFYQLLEKLKSAMEEKIHLDFSLSPPGSPSLRRSRKLLSQVFLPSNSEISVFANDIVRKALSYKDGFKSLGRINVELKNSHLNFMRYNFRDPDCARMISKAVSLSLEHQCRSFDILRESLKIRLDGISIKKGTTRSLTPEEERMWSALEWFTFLGSSPSKNVATVPSIVISLDSLSHLHERRSELSGETIFASQIDIALNFGLYRFLQELFECYETAFKQEGERLMPSAKEESMAKSQSLSKDFELPIIFEYKKGDFKFDPQLKVTGEATPRELIEWLGVNKTRIPELLYTHINTKLSDAIVWIARNS